MYLHPDHLVGIMVISIIFGAFQCFLGYRIFRFILGLMGFLGGGALAAGIGIAMTSDALVALVAGVIGGLIGAVLMSALYFIGIFLMGALFGGVLGMMLFAVAESAPEMVVLLILAVIAGIIALVFQKFMIIVSTAFSGSWSVVSGIAFLAGVLDPMDMERFFRAGDNLVYTVLLCWLVLGIAGLIVQYKASSIRESTSPTGAGITNPSTG